MGRTYACSGRWRNARCLWLAACLLGLVVAFEAASAAEEPAPASASASAEPELDPLSDEFDGLSYELDQGLAGFPDPLERSNRSVFKFNRWVDRWLLDPITRLYGKLVPGPVKQSIRNAFSNLGEPSTMFNDMLQLEWKDAGVSGARFVVNSTVGLAGLFDPASHIGLDYHHAGFGQTLALAGTPSGAYLVVPLMGPNTVRDGLGALSDMTLHPLTWFLGPTNLLAYGIYGGGQGLSMREEHVEELTALREGSVDYYAALRNAYYQNRMAEVWSRREDRRDDWAE